MQANGRLAGMDGGSFLSMPISGGYGTGCRIGVACVRKRRNRLIAYFFVRSQPETCLCCPCFSEWVGLFQQLHPTS